MPKVLISPENGIFKNTLGVLGAVVLVPLVALAKLISLPFERPIARSPAEVARYLSNFLSGAGGECDWDDFISMPIAAARLDSVRSEAAQIELPATEVGRQKLQALLQRVNAMRENPD